MDADRRRRLTPEERRSQLVALGVGFLVDRPLDELTIEELAEQAGISRALVFHYFGSKQGLHREVVTTAAAAMLAASAPRDDLAPRERLRDTLGRIVAFVRDHRGTFFSLVRGVASGDAVVRTAVDAARDEHAERVTRVFLDLGAADTVLLRVTLRAWIALAEEVLIELALGTDRAAEEIVALLERTAQGVVDAAADSS
ncbi:MAG: helix-turn-helix domain-containing protein [Microbacterium sp.]|uniref:TetR/AcrR family transcriptional regulator n=1 Tax=Microbacterium sp. TaxID=51671 RepID=UPI0039E30C6B